MHKEIPSLEYFDKAKTDKFFVILFGRMWVSVVADLLRAKRNQLETTKHCLWKEILPQKRIRHYKILQSIYFAYDVGIISSYSNRNHQAW